MCQSEDQSSKRPLPPSQTPSDTSSAAPTGPSSGSSPESGYGAPPDHSSGSSGRSPHASTGPSSGQASDPSSGQDNGPRSRPSALPNAFSPDFLKRLRTEHDHPPTPEAANAGPFRVEPFDPSEPLQSPESIEPRPPSPATDVPPSSRSNSPTKAGPPPAAAHHWACLAEGEEAPRAVLEEPDFAYLVAAALPLTGRPPRFELVEDLDAEEDLYLVVSGCGERHVDHGGLRGRTEDLAQALTMLDELRLRPRALAHYLLSVGDETLARTGRILAALAAGRAPSPASPASQDSPTAQTAETSRKDPER